MADVERKKQELLNRIEVLLAESYRLPKARKSWERRTAIDWEILVLCREMASLSAGVEPPYWAGEDAAEARENLRHERRADRAPAPPAPARHESGKPRAA
ncbi:hypothetical protein [Rhodocaloribacter sp.]